MTSRYLRLQCLMSNTYICSDIHGNFLALENWLKNHAETGDIMIQLGDFGSGFIHDKKIESLARKFSDAGCRLLVNQGNHDEPIYHKENRKFSGGSIEFLHLTHFRKINNKGFLFLGGAISVDRYQRIEGRSWWRDEKFILNESYLEELTGIDYIASHACPSFAKPLITHKNGIVDYYSQFDELLIPDLKKEGDDMARAFEIVSQKNKIKKFIFGHFHVHENQYHYGTDFQCLNIDEITMLQP